MRVYFGEQAYDLRMAITDSLVDYTARGSISVYFGEQAHDLQSL